MKQSRRINMKENKTIFAVILLGCLLFSGSNGFCGDWPQWRGLNRDGHSTEAVLITLKLIIGPGDTPDPVITILLPNED